MDELAQSWNRLTLSEREGPGCCLLDDEEVEMFSIAAKFLTKRAINMEIIAKTFTPLWRARNGFKIQPFGDHKILFSFDNKEDVDRILEGEPWSFDKHLVVMSRYENEVPLEEIQFVKTKFWVQVHGIPFKYMTIEVAKKICSVLGEVLAPKDPKLYDGGHFMRLQVSIDLSLPLCRGRLISVGDGGKQVWISFKYERLPNLCYWCWRLTHDDRDCELWIESEGTLKVKQREFGPQLRAPPFIATRKNTILVPRYYAAKKKVSLRSSSSEDHDHGKFPDSSRERMVEQSQSVTAVREESIDVEINSSLLRNKGNKIIKDDTVVQVRMNEEFTRVVKSPNVTKADMEANIEELSLAKEFGVATIQGLGKKLSKNPSSRATLSHSSKLKHARDSQDARAIHTVPTLAASTWKRRERRNTGDKTETTRSVGKKRITEVDQSNPNTKRFQVTFRDENTLSGMVGADVQPGQEQ